MPETPETSETPRNGGRPKDVESFATTGPASISERVPTGDATPIAAIQDEIHDPAPGPVMAVTVQPGEGKTVKNAFGDALQGVSSEWIPALRKR